MKNKYVIANRKSIIASLASSDISRKIDKMRLHQRFRYILIDEAKKAAQGNSNSGAYYNMQPRAMIDCKIYVTQRPGMYGHQYMAAIWITVDGQTYQASGNMSSGCGAEKKSNAVNSAFMGLGLYCDQVKYFSGTGRHEEVLQELASTLAGRKLWFMV